MDLGSAKRALRRRVAPRRRQALADAGDRIAASVCAHLLGEPVVARAPRVALYAALPDEVSMWPLFDALAAAGRKRLLPRLGPDERLSFAVVERRDELQPGAYGVLAPAEDAPVVVLGDADVVVVPGVAFDERGGRLGRGAGCYDRTFPAGQRPAPVLVGVACEAQLVESVPSGSRDRAMDAIVTERAFRWVRGNR